MKKILYILTMALIACYSCDRAFDEEIDNTYGDEYTWEIGKYTTGVLMKAYDAIPSNIDHYGGDFLDCATDNAVTRSTSSAMARLGAGQLTPLTNPVGNWGAAYEQIQNINLFLEKGGLDDPDMLYNLDTLISNTYKVRLKGEAYFLRAWWLSELLRVYGGVSNDGEALGVPIITEYLDPAENKTGLLARATYEQTAQQIFNDCDTAFTYLPLEYSGVEGTATEEKHDGRADRKMCLALKARVALYAASPAYQPQGISNAEVTEKWERAARFAYNAIAGGNLGAYQALDKTVMFSKMIGTEYIFSFLQNNRAYESSNLPPSVFGSGNTNPSQNLVDAFPCSDGRPIEESQVYDPQNPFANRDNRLALTVLYNGAPIDDTGKLLAVYYDNDLDIPALDAPGKFYDNTRTGYYLRKWISSKEDMLLLGSVKNDYHRVPLLRRAEVYLNLAEALNNAAGPIGIVEGCGGLTAFGIIANIRSVSGGITNQQYLIDHAGDADEFNEIILNERRIELAFEGHRYFDLRRTNSNLTESIYGMTCAKENGVITYTGTEAGMTDSDILIEKRAYDDERYRYSPIPYSEIVENPGMKNNLGW